MTKAEKKARRQQIHREQNLRHREQLPATKWQPPVAKPSIFWRIVSRSWKVFGGIATIVGFWALLYPRMSAKGLDIFDTNNPTSVRVTISNDNPYALRDARYYCVQVKGDTGRAQDEVRDNTVYPNDTVIGDIPIFDPKTVSCNVIDNAMRVLGMDPFVTTVDFMLVVSFRSIFIPNVQWLRSERIFHFTAERDPAGRFHILPQPQVPLPKKESWEKK